MSQNDNASQFKAGCSRHECHEHKDGQWISVKESESFAIEFADYMRSECWEYDHREQKTHSTSEHLAYFKQKYFPKYI